MQTVLRRRRSVRLVIMAVAVSASLWLAGPAAANVGQSCRLRADGTVGQTVSIIVPPGSHTAILAAVIAGNPDKSGATTYTRDQLAGLNTLILTRQAEGDRAFMSSADNQVTCLSRLVGNVVRQLDATRE